MPQFKATFIRHWVEYGEAILEAEDQDDAVEIANEMEIGSDDIEWGEMSQENGEVELVEEID